jgi:hypothetical protein
MFPISPWNAKRAVLLGCLACACQRDATSPVDGETSSSESDGSDASTDETDTTDETGTTGGTDETGETGETGEPFDDLPIEPTLHPEAWFVTIPVHDYAIVPPGDPPIPLIADSHRQFLAFAPSDNEPEHDPIFVFFNGGPAVSSAMLLGLNIGSQTFAPAATAGADLADNPHSWTQLGNLLWIDAHHVGFSYSLLADPSDTFVRQDASSFANFNAYLDAADFVRVLLEFLASHPELRDNEVILVAESYGGTRAQLMLDMLLHGQAYASGERRLIDAELDSRITEHHEAVLGLLDPEPEQVAQQFGRQILIQPAVTGSTQKYSAGELFEQPGSVVELFGAGLGLDYVTCAEKGGFCSPYSNAHEFVQAAGRSPYDTEAPVNWLSELFALVNARCNDAGVVQALLDVPLATIADMSPAARSMAWRSVAEDAYPSDAEAGDLEQTLGPLAAWDRYFLVFEYGALGRFTGFEAAQHEIDPDDPHYGEHLLRNLLWVDTLITSTERDLVVYTPALPNALREYAAIVANVEVGPGEWTIEYQADAFAEWPEPGTRTVRVPSYADGHAISMDAPGELLADVEAWLAATN